MANVEVKAHRLARTPGAVSVVTSLGDLSAPIVPYDSELHADVEGDSATYRVEITPTDSRCECAAYQFGTRPCSHIRAVFLYESYGAIWQAEQRAKQREADWKVTH